MLKLNKLYLLIAWAISCFLFFETAAHADESNEATKMTFDQPIQISRHDTARGNLPVQTAKQRE